MEVDSFILEAYIGLYEQTVQVNVCAWILGIYIYSGIFWCCTIQGTLPRGPCKCSDIDIHCIQEEGVKM